jgi:hypothetical protein
MRTTSFLLIVAAGLVGSAVPCFAERLVPVLSKKYWMDLDSLATVNGLTSFKLFLGIFDPPKPDEFLSTAANCSTQTLYRYDILNWDELVANASSPNPRNIETREGWVEEDSLPADDVHAILSAACVPH